MFVFKPFDPIIAAYPVKTGFTACGDGQADRQNYVDRPDRRYSHGRLLAAKSRPQESLHFKFHRPEIKKHQGVNGRPVHGAGVNVKWYDKNARRYKYEKATSGTDGIALLYDVPRATQAYVSANKTATRQPPDPCAAPIIERRAR